LSLLIACQTTERAKESDYDVVQTAGFDCPQGTDFDALRQTYKNLPSVSAWCVDRSDGLRQGPLKIWFGSDLVLKGRYEDGRMTGTWTSYFKSGAKRWQAEFADSRLSGTLKAWWPDGIRRLEASYTQGAADGAFRRWFSNGNIAIEGAHKEGERSGTWEIHERSGYLWETLYPNSDREPDWSGRGARPRGPGNFCDHDRIREKISRLSRRIESCSRWATPQRTSYPLRLKARYRFHQNGHMSIGKMSETPPVNSQIKTCVGIELQMQRPLLPEAGGTCIINYPFVFQ
jgi:hypothetical protein